MQTVTRGFTKLFFVGCFFLTFSSLAQAPLDVRVALVIGNAAYINVPPLGNSTNDAKSVSIILRKLGFQVIEIADGNKVQIDEAIGRLQNLLQGKQAVAMLYYAGHGLQLDWHNYMVPVDAKLSQADDVPKQTVDVDHVIASFKKAATRMNIIVLDACRDNPFPGKVSGKGLAQLDAPVGTYLAFATAPGNVAEDGDESSGNGLFTQYLLKELQRPATIEDVFKRVRLQVRKKSQGRQIPWDSSSLEEDFSFNDGNKHTFNPDDLVREAKEREAKLRADVEAAKQREAQIAREQQLEKQRLAEEKKTREQELQAQIQRDLEIAQKREIEAQKIADAKKLSDALARQKAEAEAKERERQLMLAAQEEAAKSALAEAKRKKAEADALEKEKQLALAAAQQREKSIQAALALEKAKAEEAQKAKELQVSNLQAAQDAKRKSMSRDEAIEKQFEIEKAEWDKIKESKNPDDFYDYLNKYPSGLIAQQATFALENLAKAKVFAQKDKNGIQQVAGEARFRLGDTWVSAVFDDYSGNEIRRVKSSVTKIEKGLVYIDSDEGQVIKTLDGSTVQTRNQGLTTFDPPRIDLPGGDLTVGQKWSARCIQTANSRSFWRDEDFKVVAFEEIDTPAGRFKTYKLEASSILQSGMRVKRIYWVEPGWGANIKVSRVVTQPRGSPTRDTTIIVSRTRGPA